jgi:endo-1,4-beta-xylanase
VNYTYGVWAKPLSFTTDPVVITLRIVDGQGERYVRVADGFAPSNQWTLIEGTQSVTLSPPVQSVAVYVEGPPAGVSYLLDDASMTAIDGYDWVEVANEGIDEHRKRDLIVRVEDQFGDPVSNATVAIEQTRRGFRFGSAIAASALDNPQYRDYFAERFTMATPENAWKWEATEPFQGAQFYNGADEIRDFCLANGIRIHGHNVLWAVDQWVPDWVQNLSGTPLRNAVESRVESVVGRYAGLVDAWDVNNEMLHGSFFASRLGAGFRAELFGLVNDIDPMPDLYINDYNVITQSRLQDQIDLANSLIAQGAPVHGIGVQGHYSQPVDPFLLRTQLDQLGATGLPVRITEYDYERSGASDAERADSLEAMYRVAYSHPAVDAITMWGFWAGRHWRGVEAALVELDWTINAVGERFDALLAEWTTNEIVQADPLGVVASRVFHGDYVVRASVLDGSLSDPVTFSVEPGEDAVVVTVVIDSPSCNAADIAPPLGVLDAADKAAFIALVEAEDPAADLDGDGLATMLDLIEHLRVFDAGCP